jgi:predicted ABC-type ATPase
MPARPPTIYLIAGCNGAGKTTFAREFLPKEVNVLRFLNADEIARGLSPFDPSAEAVKAGRLLLSEIRECLVRQETFGLESTLSGRSYLRLFKEARTAGCRLYLHYLWLPTATMAVARVRERVRKGGHHVPAADVRRRFQRSRGNLPAYAAISDKWAVWDNQTSPPALLAESGTCSLVDLRRMVPL